MIVENQFLVYENWTHKKAVVHNSSCGDVKTGYQRLKDHTGTNDRWFGYFTDLSSAIAFVLYYLKDN